jgi:phenylacetate-CoA ligase
VTKANYLHHYPLNMLASRGDMTEAGTWSTSSGSSGKPTYWPRGLLSLEQSIDLYDKIFRQSFQSDERSTLAVIGFAMGNWIGGTYTFTGIQHLRALGHKLSVITPGIDVATILENIADLGPYYEQIVLVGYPPFLKDVLDQAPSPVTSKDLRILMAGENISEAWRDYILKRIGKEGKADHTCLIYGTADAGIMGHETPTTIAARRLARNDPRLNVALFGDDDVQPTFVEYQPNFRFTETDISADSLPHQRPRMRCHRVRAGTPPWSVRTRTRGTDLDRGRGVHRARPTRRYCGDILRTEDFPRERPRGLGGH